MVCVYPAHVNQQLRQGVAQTHEQEGQRREATILCADPPTPQRGQATANPDEVGARYQRHSSDQQKILETEKCHFLSAKYKFLLYYVKLRGLLWS